MWGALGHVLLAGLLSARATSAPVVQLDMYRAMQGSKIGIFTEQNDDLSNLGGVLKYLHTEIIVESHNAQNRWERKYSVDAVLRRRFKVMNSPDLQPSMVALVDFGPFVTFDQGQSTNKDYDPVYVAVGDFVGVQSQQGPGFAVFREDPAFWFSVSGFCPNLPWSHMPMADGTTTARCDSDEKLCEAKGSTKAPNPRCLQHNRAVLMGGLCKDGADESKKVPVKDPDGSLGCVYTYGKAARTDLDELAGIRSQTCNGGHPCLSWFDFRQNCDDPTLKQMFNRDTGEVIDAKNVSDHRPFCVEYDIHPACDQNCSSPECLKVNGTREVGIPFWRGRCDPAANRRRVALLAQAAGIQGALDRHQTVDEDLLSQDATCLSRGSTACLPATEAEGSKGGPYCSRAFAGVCQECHVPGTKTVYRPDADINPYCPYSVLGSADYSGLPKPNCKSNRPRDMCCLYVGTCEGKDDPSEATLDVDGLLLVAQRCWSDNSSAAMLAYAGRVAGDMLKGTIDTKSLAVKQFAYQQWGATPPRQTFEDFQAALQGLLEPTPAPSPSPPPARRGRLPTPVIAVLAVVGVGALAGLAVVLLRWRRQARRPGLLGADAGRAA